MTNFFRALMGLYPVDFRERFGPEMLDVFTASYADLPQRALPRYTFLLREAKGLVLGALDEHAKNWFAGSQWLPVRTRRFHMRSEFRYPRAMAPMMLFILICIMFAIYKARDVQIHEKVGFPLHSLPLTMALALLVACVAGLLGWFVLHASHRSGVHRLSEAQTWPQAK